MSVTLHPKEQQLHLDITAQLNQPQRQSPTWEHTWESATSLFLLRLYLHHEHAETLRLFAALESHAQDLTQRCAKSLSEARYSGHIQTTIHSLQRQLEKIIGNVNRPHHEIIDDLQELQASLDALLWISHDSPPLVDAENLSAEALADLSLLEREIQEAKETLVENSKKSKTTAEARVENQQLRAQTEKLRQECANLYGTVLTQEMDDFLERTQEGPPPEPTLQDVKETWLHLQRAEELQLAYQKEKHKRNTYVSDHLQQRMKQVEERREFLQQKLVHLNHALPELKLREWWGQPTRFLLDDIDDQMATLDDQAIPLALRHIEQMEAQVVWLTELLEPIRDGAPSPNEETEQNFQIALRQLKRIRYRLRVERQERGLQHSLESKFGRKTVARIETTVIVLIFLVLLFLVAESSFSLSPETLHLMMWADTLICGFFLAEFFTKLVLVEERWLYFRRHFFVDFLPAIPFGFILWFWQTQSVVKHLTAGRAIRLVRLTRLSRYIKVLRPAIRIFRLFSFLVRAIGSLLRKYEGLFNRNIIIFPSPEESFVPQHQRLQLEIQQLRERCRRRTRMHMGLLPLGEKLDVAEERLAHLRDQMQRYPSHQPFTRLKTGGSEVVYLPKLINRMIHIDAIEVEEVLGRNMVQQAYRIFRYMSLPVVRMLPGMRGVARAYQTYDPAGMLAWLIRNWGRFLQRIQATIDWFGDFHGIVTGPKVLDRIGNTLVSATLRPARRLLLFGFFFLFLSGLIYAFDHDTLKGAAAFFAKFLGTPIIVLGSISLIPLVLGFWFRRIANASSDYFGRVAEAQFMGNLQQLKQHRTPADLTLLVQRVLHPEAVLQNHELPANEKIVDELIQQLHNFGKLEEYQEYEALVEEQQQNAAFSVEASTAFAVAAVQGPAAGTSSSATNAASQQATEIHTEEQAHQWLERERMLALYEDYLRGSPLHRSDTPTTNQLLGNLTIQNIRRHRLTMTLLDNLRIDRLDLSRPRLFHFLGPYLWFTAITESLSHGVARLIVEYNRNCIPLQEMSWQTEEAKQAYENWLQAREAKVKGQPFKQKLNEIPLEQQEFRSTAFNALHFLSTTSQRDSAIRRIFGERVLRLLQAERRQLFRETFGFYPYHQLPKEYRTFNVYQWYLNNFAEGRFFLFPFKMLWWLLKGFVWGILQIRRLVRDVLRPPSEDDARQVGHAPFDVAVRKINRMRKPIYIEYMRLRSRLDAEYLGLYLPGQDLSGLEGHTYQADLDFIAATEIERIEFHEASNARREQMGLLDEYLTYLGWKDESFVTYLTSIDPALAERSNEVMRAITSAFSADYHGVRSFVEAQHKLNQIFEEGREHTQRVPIRQRWSSHLRRFFRHVLLFRKDKEYNAFRQHWERSDASQGGKDALKASWHLYLTRRQQLLPWVLFAAEQDTPLLERAKIELETVLRTSQTWTEELLSLRTLQTITRLDIRLYRELIYTLGGYNHPKS